MSGKIAKPRVVPDPADADANETAADYEVGYRKPPRDKQFKKGQSGNPRGRRKSLSAPETAAAMMSRRVTANMNGKRTRMTMQEAMLFSQFRKAMDGDHKAAKLLLELQKQAPPPREEFTQEDMEAAFKEASEGFTLDELRVLDRFSQRMAAANDKIRRAKANR